jgi:hypothetical protein
MRIMRSTTARVSLLLAITAIVCPGQFLPSDSANYAAKVVTLTGQVSVLKDLQPWAISAGDSIQVTQAIVTGPDGHAVLQVSDGSTIEVYPNSKFVFRKNREIGTISSTYSSARSGCILSISERCPIPTA